jgi:putative Holliday junction resolvase
MERLSKQSTMRILGIDFGRARIGLAMSDELGITAQPLTTIEGGSEASILQRLRDALGGIELDLIVMGLPLRLDGTEGGSARAARKLAVAIADGMNVPYELWDERFTTVQSDRILKEAGVKRGRLKAQRDKIAAAIMLQSYLDAKRNDE